MIRMVICMVIIDIRLILIVAEIAGMAIRMFIKMVRMLMRMVKLVSRMVKMVSRIFQDGFRDGQHCGQNSFWDRMENMVI